MHGFKNCWESRSDGSVQKIYVAARADNWLTFEPPLYIFHDQHFLKLVGLIVK